MDPANRGNRHIGGAHEAHFSVLRSLLRKLNKLSGFAASLKAIFVLPQIRRVMQELVRYG